MAFHELSVCRRRYHGFLRGLRPEVAGYGFIEEYRRPGFARPHGSIQAPAGALCVFVYG